MNESIKKFITDHWFLLVLIAAGICLCLFAGSRVHDNGIGTDTVRHEIGTAQRQQQQISAGLQETESTVGSVASSIEKSESANRDAESTADDIEETVEQQRAAIADCQRLIRTIRARGTRTAAHN